MRRFAPLFLLFVSCASTAVPPQPQCNPGHSILNATMYVQSSAEYRAAAMQTYAAARRALDEALADPTRVGATEETNNDPSQPPAVILDADETVLDNTPFEARVILKGMNYDEAMWKQWTSEGAATAIPGAAEFLAYAKSRGVTVFYITNRDEDERAGTMSNLRKLGYPLDDDVQTLLLRENKVSDKSPRRKSVADRYRVLLLVGDDFNDFANVRRASWQERDELLTKMKDWWGTRWFMIPNPMYGSWEHAAIGGGGTPCEQVERKVKALRP